MSKKIDQSKQLEFWLDEHDILTIRVADENAKVIEVNMEEALYSLGVQKRISEEKGKKILVLSNLTSLTKISKEVRDFAKTPAGREVDNYVLAYAFVASNLWSRMIGNMIMSLFKHGYPMKIFPTEEKAIEWLLTQKEG